MAKSSRDIIRPLAADGWYEAGHTGSHKHFKHPTIRIVTAQSRDDRSDRRVAGPNLDSKKGRVGPGHVTTQKAGFLPIPRSRSPQREVGGDGAIEGAPSKLKLWVIRPPP